MSSNRPITQADVEVLLAEDVPNWEKLVKLHEEKGRVVISRRHHLPVEDFNAIRHAIERMGGRYDSAAWVWIVPLEGREEEAVEEPAVKQPPTELPRAGEADKGDYDLKKSKDAVGPLLPVIVAIIDGKEEIVDGFHRLAADPNWPKEVNTKIKTRKQLLVARIVANAQRRRVPKEERKRELTQLAMIVKDEGKKPGEIAGDIAELTGFTDRYIRELLPDEYKMISRARFAELSSAKVEEEEVPEPDELEDYIREHHTVAWILHNSTTDINYRTNIPKLTDEELDFCIKHENRVTGISQLLREKEKRLRPPEEPNEEPEYEEEGPEEEGEEEPEEEEWKPEPLEWEGPTDIDRSINFLLGGELADIKSKLMEKYDLTEEEASEALGKFKQTYPSSWNLCYDEDDKPKTIIARAIEEEERLPPPPREFVDKDMEKALQWYPLSLVDMVWTEVHIANKRIPFLKAYIEVLCEVARLHVSEEDLWARTLAKLGEAMP